jgi:hypothetical protein
MLLAWGRRARPARTRTVDSGRRWLSRRPPHGPLPPPSTEPVGPASGGRPVPNPSAQLPLEPSRIRDRDQLRLEGAALEALAGHSARRPAAAPRGRPESESPGTRPATNRRLLRRAGPGWRPARRGPRRGCGMKEWFTIDVRPGAWGPADGWAGFPGPGGWRAPLRSWKSAWRNTRKERLAAISSLRTCACSPLDVVSCVCDSVESLFIPQFSWGRQWLVITAHGFEDALIRAGRTR